MEQDTAISADVCSLKSQQATNFWNIMFPSGVDAHDNKLKAANTECFHQL